MHAPILNATGVHGDEEVRESSGWRCITDNVGEEFQPGSVDTFVMHAPFVGELVEVEVKVDGAGSNLSSSAWHVKHLIVDDPLAESSTTSGENTRPKVYFHFDRWVRCEADSNGKGGVVVCSVGDTSALGSTT
jgi:hypothetical protein